MEIDVKKGIHLYEIIPNKFIPMNHKFVKRRDRLASDFRRRYVDAMDETRKNIYPTCVNPMLEAINNDPTTAPPNANTSKTFFTSTMPS